MAKQALLTSYKSLLDAHTSISSISVSETSEIKEDSKNQIPKYLKLVENIAEELEKEFYKPK